MALGDVVVKSNGDRMISTGRGWVPSSPELEAASAAGFLGAFAQNALELASFGLFEAPEELGQVSPVASKAGTAAAFVGVAALPAFRGAQAGVRALRGGRAAAGTGEAVGAVEAAAPRAGGGFGRTPQGFIKKPSDMVPESFKGTVRQVEAGIGSLPGARMLVDLVNTQQRKIMGAKVGRAMGMSKGDIKVAGGRLRPADVKPALDRIDDVYDATRNAISEKVTTQQVQKIGREALTENFITAQELAQLGRAADATGDTLLDLRSLVRASGRSEASRTGRARANEIVDEIQELIKFSTKGTDQFAQVSQADRQWKVWSAVSKGGTINGEGWLNLNGLKSNLTRSFGTRVGKAAERGGLRPVEAELFDAIDELGPINFQIPSSGTTERQIAANAVLLATGISVWGVN